MESLAKISFSNAAIGDTIEVLHNIKSVDKNIAIFERSVSSLENEIIELLLANVKIMANGLIDDINDQLQAQLFKFHCSGIVDDITKFLQHFKTISGEMLFNVSLNVIDTDMCRKFHTDVKSLRLLCTYTGAGTLWLPEIAANRNALQTGKSNVVKDQNLIQQTQAGDVLILKGVIYPGAQAIIHRSPSIEESSGKRLLLRIDINEGFNF